MGTNYTSKNGVMAFFGPKLASPAPEPQAPTEAEKVRLDALHSGYGASLDGKHIPITEVFATPTEAQSAEQDMQDGLEIARMADDSAVYSRRVLARAVLAFEAHTAAKDERIAELERTLQGYNNVEVLIASLEHAYEQVNGQLPHHLWEQVRTALKDWSTKGGTGAARQQREAGK